MDRIAAAITEHVPGPVRLERAGFLEADPSGHADAVCRNAGPMLEVRPQVQRVGFVYRVFSGAGRHGNLFCPGADRDHNHAFFTNRRSRLGFARAIVGKAEPGTARIFDHFEHHFISGTNQKRPGIINLSFN